MNFQFNLILLGKKIKQREMNKWEKQFFFGNCKIGRIIFTTTFRLAQTVKLV